MNQKSRLKVLQVEIPLLPRYAERREASVPANIAAKIPDRIKNPTSKVRKKTFEIKEKMFGEEKA